ncbi:MULTISPECIES: metal ABC transporter substrate-binding protein [unclassified Streptomyces]|uniref:metal ABC transporter substrate-binding protein n=1 Tax=unclassified Streptomyces TaxID=2593676 RepID=UPI001368974D|nr:MULTISPECIES: metal ABC transporter substrate-binding protein [unclassified Streptomyces]NDZ99846.1 zinc ABC transporter substrate-binding protein [Streptomyces sp. SID10116]MYY86391.1 zinc ABC transporter solute-binding protein [Streptomyces sp. SID335]MYZ14522.1 zinc ABC transporter solute-binding protein [Streptomyces sp. SID337]NDZ88271.1 zinc ABC transporter substrate-binding protein [Streptomyces sp. SID10115]NEB44877.1 zinc ABC transporter substrate-binding protein [Streptomyces sp. 
MNVRRLIPTAALASATVLGLTALTACSTSAADDKDGKLDVVASFYPMQYLAEQIGGDHVSVTTLTGPGQEPHDLDVSAKQRGELEESDVALYLKGLQPAVDDAIDQSGIGTKVDAASLTSTEKHGNEVGGHADEHEDEGHGEEGHEGHDHGHSHEGADPHIWLDPVKYAEVAEGVGKALEKADPDHAKTYEKNTAALVKKLGGLDKSFKDGLKNTDSKVFITTHAAFGYLAERYGLIEEAISGLDPEGEPSAKRVKDLQKMAEADGVTTVFYETLVSDRTAKTLAKDTGLKTDVLDPVEGITDDSKGEDYIQVMESNLKALQKALGAK